MRTSGSRLRGLALFAAASLFIAACGRVQAPSPPASEPGFQQEVVVAGAPITVAAKAARTLARFAYNTRRFGSDSTWAYRAVDRINVRLRYVMPSRDSTRILAEYWGVCERRGCLQAELAGLVAGITAEEAPPP